MRQLLINAVLLCLGLVAHDALAFRAAVYEHVQQGNPWTESREAVAVQNLRKYTDAAHNASVQGADIVVFPENGIMFFLKNRSDIRTCAENIPEPGNVNPCLQKRMARGAPSASGPPYPVLSNLSCIAQENNIYLVANLVDKKPCSLSNGSSCPEDGLLFYNTNVAFDRNGTLVSRYHKNHLFVEPQMVEPDPPEFAVFETDFGRKLGMFICFDVLFKEASQLVTQYAIDVAVMSTWWFDELPGWFAVAVQQSWSMVHDVPLLASEIQRPETGSLGSGIYLGKQGPLIYSYSPDNRDKLLVADVDSAVPEHPRYPGDQVSASHRVHFQADTSDHVALKLEGASGEMAACQRGFCCSLQYTTPAMNDSFFLLVRSGYKRIQTLVDFGMQECMVTRCVPKAGRPCGHFPYTSGTTFNELVLTANFSVPDVFPALVSDQLALTSLRHWSFNRTDSNRATLSLVSENPPLEPLVSAVLVGRVYKNDSPITAP